MAISYAIQNEDTFEILEFDYLADAFRLYSELKTTLADVSVCLDIDGLEDLKEAFACVVAFSMAPPQGSRLPHVKQFVRRMLSSIETRVLSQSHFNGR